MPEQRLPADEATANAEDAAWFAAAFAPCRIDPRPWSDAASPGACLSEWHVSALGMRMICRAFLDRTASLGAPGVEEVEWLRPVFVGDRLRLDSRVTTLRPSRSRPDMGLVGFAFSMANQHGACVMRQSNVILVQRRTGETRT